MRGIGSGQTIHVYVIPEVADLISREIRAANSSDSLASTAIFETMTRLRGGETASLASDALQEAEKRNAEVEKVLEALVAWLVINSMRTEQTQWSMLCVQNASNIYRKNAFRRILSGAEPFCTGEFKEADRDAPSANAPRDEAGGGEKDVETLPLLPSLKVFDEAIDFSLEAAVPDPIPFADKLRHLLTSHFEFIVSEEQHKIGHQLMTEVNEFTCASESNGDDGANLDTQQEREMEQEQEKEVKARRDQQIEVEKFVEREYSRHQERPTPWSIFSPCLHCCLPLSSMPAAACHRPPDGLPAFARCHSAGIGSLPDAVLTVHNGVTPWAGRCPGLAARRDALQKGARRLKTMIHTPSTASGISTCCTKCPCRFRLRCTCLATTSTRHGRD
jgi:hypothetical protein